MGKKCGSYLIERKFGFPSNLLKRDASIVGRSFEGHLHQA